ncbi:MAG: hypothetical protein A2234_07835 [Elusimicrobia bacterium RIFOXYA2_FULL_58_8]|nr:MAG: hypothetical protein A2285_01725 [Elusimicrobia bacterium RIFOXYA12_FULL_57_11]OGS12672.1 MAG: hypothetical protein A2234_07835 [Elusimicrobia bacterium RIFOXYA2_FULL_58_8]
MRIEALNIKKVFPAPVFSGITPLRALDGLNLAAGPGVTGLEGPNGSGKTTLFKVLAGILEPDGGKVTVDGQTAGARRLRGLAAFCPPNPRSFYYRLSVLENLRFFGALAGLSPARSAEGARALGARLGLCAADLERRFDRLSEGNMQKVSLIRAFSRRAPVVLLDEPFHALDEKACAGLVALIAETGRAATVLLSSHSPALLAAAADRTFRLEAGRATAP